MGTKGGTQTVQATNQSQSYTPAGGGYMQAALGKATDAASQPFNVPQAPVAGFSQDQLNAFQQYRDAQGSAQPYYNTASNYFSPQGAQDFMNPYAASVMAGMKDVFGQQASQNTGQLTQAAGGVGADRIGVGQAELAKQQDLAAGQTLSGIYNQSVQQAQQAGQGQMALGQNVQNSNFQGAGQLLGIGGLQQQLQQQQLNAPYQQQVAQAAFPYQQAQFLAGITGALAPGMGGTTQGYGNNNGTVTPPAPSIWSQLIGAGTAGAGIYGATGGFGSGSKGSNTGTGDGSWYGPSSVGGQPLSARGGRINPYNIDMSRQADGSYGYAEGGEVPEEGGFTEASLVPARPIDISQHSIIPQVQMQPSVAPQMPQLNLNPTPPQQPASGGGDSTMKTIGDVAKLAMMFANTGGRVNPYASGGAVGYDEGGDVRPDFNDRFPMRLAGDQAMDAWRSGVDKDLATGTTAMALAPGRTTASAPSPYNAMAFAGPEGPDVPAVAAIKTAASGSPDGADASVPLPRPRPAAAYAADAMAGSDTTGATNPYSPSPVEAPALPRQKTMGDSPWMALMQAGLGMMAGTSPYAGVNIGAGGQQALKVLQSQKELAQKDENTDLSARRLMQEAAHHNDQYTKMTPYQSATLAQSKAQMQQTRELAEAEAYSPAGTIQTKDGLHPAFYDKKTAQVIDGITGKPPEKTDAVIPKGGSRNAPEEINHVVDGIIDGSSPPSLTGLYGDAVHVRSGLHAKGFNLAKAQQEWESAKKQTAAVNSSRMTAYVGLNKSVDRTIDEVKELADQLQQGGIPMLNRAQLQGFIKANGNSEKGQLATRYMTAVNTLKEEFANLANGGYAPTEAAWKLANEQVNGDFGVKQMHASLNEIQRLIRYRIQAIPNLDTMGPGSTNRYTGAGQPPAAGTSPPAGHGAVAPDPKGPAAGAVRFRDLLKTMPEEQAYKVLQEEGYHQ